ncbi:hypothetical protein H0X48_00210 [Candidatus Dependentiae bacterium]|nr:hypothetical protein [Candidatus Dependentiae bacterium]
MLYRTALFSIVMTASNLLAVCGCNQQTPLKTALNQAQPLVAAYIQQASVQERQNLARYLTYYRSEGGYQAVTPAPKEVREALTPASATLFNKIKELAAPFVAPSTTRPGASKLSAAGNTYYQELIKMVQASLVTTA